VFVHLAFLWIYLLAMPSAGDAAIYVKKFEARYRAEKTLQATFLERYTENGQMVRSEAGIAYFRRPGKMRWEYQAPERDLFLVDGKTAWFYVPSDYTVTRDEGVAGVRASRAGQSRKTHRGRERSAALPGPRIRSRRRRFWDKSFRPGCPGCGFSCIAAGGTRRYRVL
jgi:hypothetical protein